MDLINQIAQAIANAINNIGNSFSTLLTSVAAINTTLQAAFPTISGTFTCSAAATTTVANTNTTANSIIVIQPTNSAGGTLMGGSKSLYISARTAGTSFAVTTASGVAAAGTETFNYIMVNP